MSNGQERVVFLGENSEGSSNKNKKRVTLEMEKDMRITRDLTVWKCVSMFSSELLGSFLLIYFACHPYQQYGLFQSVVSNGIITFGILYCTSIVSVSYVPSLTLLSCIMQLFASLTTGPYFYMGKRSREQDRRANSWRIFIVSLAGILIGSVLAGLLLFATLGTNNNKGAVFIDTDICTEWHAFAIQLVIMTVYLLYSINFSIRRNPNEAIGRAILGGVLVMYSLPFTGGVLDPLRWFVPALITAKWDMWYIYASASLAALALAFIVHWTYAHILKVSETPVSDTKLVVQV